MRAKLMQDSVLRSSNTAGTEKYLVVVMETQVSCSLG